jgi:hypothetical protein
MKRASGLRSTKKRPESTRKGSKGGLLTKDHNHKFGSQEPGQTRYKNSTHGGLCFDTKNAVLSPGTIHGEANIVIMEDAMALSFKYGKGRGVNDSRFNRPGKSRQDTSAGQRAKFQLYAVPVKNQHRHLTYKQFTEVHASDHKQKILNHNAGVQPERAERSDEGKKRQGQRKKRQGQRSDKGKKHKEHPPCSHCNKKHSRFSSYPISSLYCSVCAKKQKTQ